MSENEAKRGLLGDFDKHSNCIEKQNRESASIKLKPKLFNLLIC